MSRSADVKEGQLRTWTKHVGLVEPEYFLVVRIYDDVQENHRVLWADLLSPSGMKSIPVSLFQHHSEIIENVQEKND